MRYFTIVFVLILGFTSCVPAKKYNEIVEKEKKCSEELEKFKKRALVEGTQFESLQSQYEKLKESNDELKLDTTRLGNSYRSLNARYNQEIALREALEELVNDVKSSDSKQLAKLTEDLETKIRKNQEIEDSLGILDKELNKKQMLLAEREQRVEELERIIREQSEAVTTLKNKISQALTGFEGKGLTVEENDGKVYVKLDESLLFATGKTEVFPNGKKAIIDLAKAIEDEIDFEIIVEGHTDDVPMNASSSPKNNWELSVLRATSVIEIITENSNVDPKILMAAGRSEYHPTSEDKARNRRIEVIIAPNLKDILRMLSE